MSSHYGIVFPEFWSGETGRAIRTDGGKDGQLVALYLMSAPSATMIGLFPLSLRDLHHHTGMGLKGLARAFRVLGALGFADYDGRSEHVWVREMAKFRLSLQKRSPLDPDDKRVTGIQRLYDKLAENPFLEVFFDRYARELRLRGKRRSGRQAEPLLDVVLRSPFEGPSKPVNRDQGSGTEIRDQEDLPPLSRRSVENLSKTKPPKNADGKPARKTSGVAATLRDRKGTARARSDSHGRGMESPNSRPVGPIGFRGPGSADAEPVDVGSGTRDGESPRTSSGATTDPVVVTGRDDGRATQPPGSEPHAGGVTRARATDTAAPDRQRTSGAEHDAAQSDHGTDSAVAPGARVLSAGGGSGVADVDQNAEGMGAETPGQAELRRTIERLRRERTS